MFYGFHSILDKRLSISNHILQWLRVTTLFQEFIQTPIAGNNKNRIF